MKQFDVTALGELLIDFTENGLSSQGNYLLEANPGGAPCNVLAMLAKLGKKTDAHKKGVAVDGTHHFPPPFFQKKQDFVFGIWHVGFPFPGKTRSF